jgi:outer membrane immunogenic protein
MGTRRGLALSIWSAAAIGFAGGTQAADLPVYKAAPKAAAAVYNWTGFYLGAHVGVGRSENDYRSQFFNAAGIPDPARFGGADGSGGLVGAQAGFNWQAGNVVFGIEADVSRTSINADLFVDPDLSYRSRNRWLATATGRLGWAFDNLLIYAKGGAAWTGAAMTALVEDVPLEGKNASTGWTFGGGFEYGLDPSWSFKLEYAYYKFDDEDYASFFAPGNGTVRYTLSENKSTVKFGINYRFGAGKASVVAKY